MAILKIVVSLLILLFPMAIHNSNNEIQTNDLCYFVGCDVE